MIYSNLFCYSKNYHDFTDSQSNDRYYQILKLWFKLLPDLIYEADKTGF